MKRHFLALAFIALFSASASAQAPMQGKMHDKGGAKMPMTDQMQGMPGGEGQHMHDMMGMMREMMPMMMRMQKKGMTPARHAEMMKKMAPMMQAMMPLMTKMMSSDAAAGSATGSSAAYEAAAMKMHADMPMTYSGDADVDFAKGMIPHHEGAIAMANVLLQYGKSADMRKFAEDVIKAQTAEIATLRDWLAKIGK